ncbi:hypothetical protein TELCIR_05960 [Teladorsagia circumcincta]|uniref:Uncharacterized protein n=1 Tax=Teladorsagia circumcincta TaxID=45464 RepID=A0A2G9UPC4_TELCI|nr:hypothetical protein TELCIR_05960 [Teladorsagia circumcincta]
MLMYALCLFSIFTVVSTQCDDISKREDVLDRSTFPTNPSTPLISTTASATTTATSTAFPDSSTTLKEDLHGITTTLSPCATVRHTTQIEETRATVQETDSTTSAAPTTSTTSTQEEVESSSFESSTTTEAPEASSESAPIAETTSTGSTTNAPVAGFRGSITELDKPDLSRIYRKLFPYLNSDRN